eukprot:3684585-Pleurochrysis_carterae.AAC.1
MSRPSSLPQPQSAAPLPPVDHFVRTCERKCAHPAPCSRLQSASTRGSACAGACVSLCARRA